MFQNMYSQKNKPRIIALKEELFKSHMKETETVSKFIHKVVSVRNNLLSARASITKQNIVEMIASKFPKSFDVTVNTITRSTQCLSMT